MERSAKSPRKGDRQHRKQKKKKKPNKSPLKRPTKPEPGKCSTSPEADALSDTAGKLISDSVNKLYQKKSLIDCYSNEFGINYKNSTYVVLVLFPPVFLFLHQTT